MGNWTGTLPLSRSPSSQLQLLRVHECDKWRVVTAAATATISAAAAAVSAAAFNEADYVVCVRASERFLLGRRTSTILPCVCVGWLVDQPRGISEIPGEQRRISCNYGIRSESTAAAELTFAALCSIWELALIISCISCHSSKLQMAITSQQPASSRRHYSTDNIIKWALLSTWLWLVEK